MTNPRLQAMRERAAADYAAYEAEIFQFPMPRRKRKPAPPVVAEPEPVEAAEPQPDPADLRHADLVARLEELAAAQAALAEVMMRPRVIELERGKDGRAVKAISRIDMEPEHTDV